MTRNRFLLIVAAMLMLGLWAVARYSFEQPVSGATLAVLGVLFMAIAAFLSHKLFT